jgi:hypothetical protein
MYFFKKNGRISDIFPISGKITDCRKNSIFLSQIWIRNRTGKNKTPRGRFELPRRRAPAAFEATAFPG